MRGSRKIPFFLMFLMQLFLTGKLEAANFQSCKSVDLSAKSSPQVLGAGLFEAQKEFLEMSRAELQQSLDCLGKPIADDICGSRREYFLKSLPVEWKIYRQQLAMSRYSIRVLTDPSNQSGESLFNAELTGGSPFWFLKTEIEALTSDEKQLVKKDWDQWVRRIRAATIKTWDAYLAQKTRNFLGRDQILEAKTLLHNADIGILMRIQNPWVQSYLDELRKLLLHLNQKRALRQAGKHPLLVYLEKAELDSAEIVRALRRMQDNLNEVEDEMAGNATLAMDRRPQVSRRGLRAQFDHFAILESYLARHPEHCGLAEEVMTLKHQMEFVKNIGLLAAGGVLFFTSPYLAVPGFAILQTYTLTESVLEAGTTRKQALINPNVDLNLKSIDTLYQRESDMETEMILSPLILSGITLYKLPRWR